MAENNNNNRNNHVIVVDDGTQRVPINNKLGQEIGVFYFRPTDIGIIERFNTLAGSFDKIVEPLENVNINSDGTVNEQDVEEFAIFKEAERRLYEACDTLFGGNVSEAFFGCMHPFSPINGGFYCEQVLQVVGEYINRQFDVETKRINRRVEKYTHGYTARTGKHRNGKR